MLSCSNPLAVRPNATPGSEGRDPNRLPRHGCSTYYRDEPKRRRRGPTMASPSRTAASRPPGSARLPPRLAWCTCSARTAMLNAWWKVEPRLPAWRSRARAVAVASTVIQNLERQPTSSTRRWSGEQALQLRQPTACTPRRSGASARSSATSRLPAPPSRTACAAGLRRRKPRPTGRLVNGLTPVQRSAKAR